MAKPEWGKKRICTNCNTKYYDLNKLPIICPSCGIEFDTGISKSTKSSKSKGLLTKEGSEKKQNVSEEDSNIDDTDIDIIEDDDPLLEINKENQDTDAEIEINIDDDISFIDDDEINGDDVVDEDTLNEEKK